MKRWSSGGIEFLYCATVFFSSAMLLVLEIVAGRLLAPYIGVSIYTWTSIIGIILAGLSLGNWIGGRLADKGFGHQSVALVLVASAVSALAVLPLIGIMAGPIQSLELDLASASMIYVLGLFFIPSVLIGIIVPLITTLYLDQNSQTGKVVGRMHALGAMGSILGTFATGLFLIQWFGTRSIIVFVAGVLFLFAIPFFFVSKASIKPAAGSLIIFALTGGMALNSVGFENPCDEESNYYCLRVVDEIGYNGEVHGRTLVLDHMIHSTNIKSSPAELVTPYVQAMDQLILRQFDQPDSKRYFFAGGGAYTHPRAVKARFEHARIIVSEIDPMVTTLARDRLYFDPEGVEVRHGDARNVLREMADRSLDVVVNDVFHDVSIPYHLTTLEYATMVKEKLTDDGLYLANVIDVFPENQLVQSMVRTLKLAFSHVQVWVVKPDGGDQRMSFVLSASDEFIPGEMIRIPPKPDSVGDVWFQIGDFVEQQIQQSDSPVLTDDFTPVERLLAPLLVTRAGV